MKCERLLICLGDGVFAHLESPSLKLYAPTPQAAEDAASQFRCYLKPGSAAKPRFYIICLRDHGPSTETVSIERSAPVTTEELALHYGADFPGWEKEWTQRMCRTSSGLSILHGPPGCGKTSYLGALMSRLIDKSVFYFVPVSEAAMLSSPAFVNFWVEQTRKHGKKQKIAILEDAEELLLPRDGDSRDKVSNLLNIADGFLGDYLRLHVVLTTNVPITQFDPAILRPGRLIGIREFRRLNQEDALRLAKAKGLVMPDQADFSLAELYCSRADTDRVGQAHRIGFA